MISLRSWLGVQANIARTEADLARLQAAPAGGSVAQAMSLRARLRKLQASDASDRRATAPAGAVPEVRARTGL